MPHSWRFAQQVGQVLVAGCLVGQWFHAVAMQRPAFLINCRAGCPAGACCTGGMSSTRRSPLQKVRTAGRRLAQQAEGPHRRQKVCTAGRACCGRRLPGRTVCSGCRHAAPGLPHQLRGRLPSRGMLHRGHVNHQAGPTAEGAHSRQKVPTAGTRFAQQVRPVVVASCTEGQWFHPVAMQRLACLLQGLVEDSTRLGMYAQVWLMTVRRSVHKGRQCSERSGEPTSGGSTPVHLRALAPCPTPTPTHWAETSVCMSDTYTCTQVAGAE